MRYIAVILFLSIFIKSNAQTITFNKFLYDTIPNPILNVVSTDMGYVIVGPELGNNNTQNIKITFVDLYGNKVSSKTISKDSVDFICGSQNSLIKTIDGGYVLAGSKKDYLAATNSSLLIKFDNNFDTLWTKTFLTDSLFVHTSQCVQTNDGGFALVGSKRTDNNDSESLLIRTDNFGNMLWYKLYNDSADASYRISKSFDGGFVLGGETTRQYPFGDWRVIKVDSIGNVKWSKIIGSPNYYDNWIIGLITTKDSGYVMSGGYGVSELDNHFNQKSRILKLNNEGEIVWDKKYFEPFYDADSMYVDTNSSVFMSVIEDIDKNLYVTGTKNNNQRTYSKLYKLNPQGDSLWSREYQVPENVGNVYLNVLKKVNTGIIMAGYGYINDSSSIPQAFLVKTNCIGFDSPPLSNYTFSINNNIVNFNNLSQKVDSCVWDFGDGSPFLYSHICDSVSHTYSDTGSYSVSLVAYNACTVADNDTIIKSINIESLKVEEISFNNSELSIYPNPSNAQITIKSTNEPIETIVIYNSIGVKIDNIILNNNSASYIYNFNNISGLYLIKVKTKKNQYYRKIVFR
ncbi:MAG: hypothetical protein A2033_15255 [Bacteroidetes bacterium GWA2_31_9]|nr:MAG: hypothetical protein A2033_15255 [Bacteroidetes bacterium GWA2_31_9]